ncbi:MAG: diphosphate--fructose-6-phosphate 1-phosphotransferase [Parachlamydiales bacterium]|nr:diphosphate--fructose-6-phosphate 1-phosphotransferase [Parachlamydiales bacterium]
MLHSSFEQNQSPIQKLRRETTPKIPSILKHIQSLQAHPKDKMHANTHQDELQRLFPLTYGQSLIEFDEVSNLPTKPLKVGVVLSGGQAPGGHNVIAGLYDALQAFHEDSQLFGFLNGPAGILKNQTLLIEESTIDPYRNQGGFDLLGSGRTKIETEEQLRESLKTMNALDLDGLVVVGGDDSNTNAAVLAETFKKAGCKTVVIGVPKTIDGDLKNEHVEVSFGFDTACKIYSEMIGNLEKDALSSKKYYHFVKLMGRSASHIALECALQTHPNMTLIGEELAHNKSTLKDITKQIADMVCARSAKGLEYGVILIPEGLIEFIPEIGQLLKELNMLLAPEKPYQMHVTTQGAKALNAHLSAKSLNAFETLPELIKNQMLLDRDPHGNVQVAMIATETLLMMLVKKELEQRAVSGQFSGSFNPVSHYFGYEGRAGLPSLFDSNYCYSLGAVAALLVKNQVTGYMSIVKKLNLPVEDWQICGIPLTTMMNVEMRHGKLKPVIKKALVELDSSSFKVFEQQRSEWQVVDHYRSPGPMQFTGDPAISESIPLSLMETTSYAIVPEQLVKA